MRAAHCGRAIPEDVWFIIPEKKVRGMWSLGLYPKLERAKYRRYQEAWELLRGPVPVVIARIEAVAEESLVMKQPSAGLFVF